MDQHEKIDINILKPYENNARTHSADQLEMLGNSIREFGFINPVIIDENDMILVGHGRVMAAKQIGIAEVPFRRVTNLSEDQKKAYIIADNKLSDMAGWDDELLLEELESIELDMSQFGFDEIKEGDIDIIEDDFGMDEAEGSTAEPKSKRGDIYQLGDHFLMCGDSTNAEDVQSLMRGGISPATANAMITDPQYNVNYEEKTKDRLTIDNDNIKDDKFRQFLVMAFQNADAVMREGAAFYIWHGDIEGRNFRNACHEIGWQIRQCLIWVKNQMVLGRQDYQSKHEPCLYGWKDGAAHYFTDERTHTTVIEEAKPQRNDIHPTMKPIGLMSRLIMNSTQKGDVVLDLFGGSGTTLIACEQLNRKCYMMELDPHYVDAIIERWENFTGKKAVQING